MVITSMVCVRLEFRHARAASPRLGTGHYAAQPNNGLHPTPYHHASHQRWQ